MNYLLFSRVNAIRFGFGSFFVVELVKFLPSISVMAPLKVDVVSGANSLLTINDVAVSVTFGELTIPYPMIPILWLARLLAKLHLLSV